MNTKSKVLAEVKQQMLSDYDAGLRSDTMFEKYQEYCSSATLSRWIRKNRQNRSKSGPSRQTCLFQGCSKDAYRTNICRDHYDIQSIEQKGSCNVTECKVAQKAKGMCNLHYQRFIRNKPMFKDTACWLNHQGYICEYLPNHFQANSDGRVLQHRRVMAESLGRRLESYETVHHKDGNKVNNDKSNLELWAKMQPAGQRVKDLLAYAHQIIELYEGKI